MVDKVLCVDDDANVLRLFQAIGTQQTEALRHFEIETVQSAEQALVAVAANGPYAVIVSDMQMPGMNGIQLLGQVRQFAPHTVRMMLTGCADLQVAMDAVNDGNIFRFLTKPCLPQALVKAIEAGIEQYRLVTAEKELLEKTLMGSIQLLMDILGLVNPTAFGRATRVRDVVKQMAAELRLTSAWELEIAALLSQTGCVTVPEQTLRRAYRGGELTPDEQQMFADHARLGHQMIALIPRLEMVAIAIAYQEKRFDGSGAPTDDKKGAEIPLGARVLKVALDFDSLESKGLAKDQALDCLRQRDGWYDPSILDALEAVVRVEATLMLKEVKVADLLARLESIQKLGLVLQPVLVQQRLGRMILAENVWTNKDILILSKGHEITLPLLERLRSYSRNVAIREPIRVWVSSRASASQAT